jgi:tyrosine decarboxylase/aspartate 1-decarboxylase
MQSIKFPYKGNTKVKIVKELKSRLQEERDNYLKGKVLSSMCSQPHNFALKVFKEFLTLNLGDPNLFLECSLIEKEAISMLSSLFGKSDAKGFIVSGGSEANLTSLYLAKKLKRGKEVIFADSAHISIYQACDILNLKPVVVKVGKDYKMSLDKIKKRISKDTLAVVASAGTTELGVVDPIKQLSEICQKHDLFLHVDASFGGFILPFLKILGYEVNDFDFRLNGVNSITVDAHKMGLCPIPCGSVLFRNFKYIKFIEKELPYGTNGGFKLATISGTRQGASAAALWAMIKHLGIEGYCEVVKDCMNITRIVKEEVLRMKNASLVVEPEMNIIGIKLKGSLDRIIFELNKRRWKVSRSRNFLRIVIMPHVTKDLALKFCKDLKEVLS